MRDTSLDSYQELKPTLGAKQEVVFQAIITLGCPTDLEITKYLGLTDPNKVRPRRKELLDMGIIKECEKRACSISKRTVWSWRVK